MPHQRWCVVVLRWCFCSLLSVVVKTSEKERVVDKAWFRCACPSVNSKLLVAEDDFHGAIMEVKLEDLARKKRELKTDFTNTRRNLTVESTNEVPNQDDVKAWRSHLTTVYDETKKVIMEYMEAVVDTDSRRHAGLQKQYKQLEGQYSDAMELARSVLIRSSRASLAASTTQTPSPKQSPLRGATPLLASVREESREILDLRAALQDAPFLGRQDGTRVMLPRAADYGERVKVEPDSRVVMFSGQRVGEPAEPFPTVAMATASAHAPPQTDMINSNACTALSAAAAEYQPRSSVLPASFATMTTGSNAPAINQEQGFLIHDPADQTPSMMYATYGNNSARPQQAYMYQQQQPQWSASNSAVVYNSPVSTGPSHTISAGASQYDARPSAGMQAPRTAVFAPVPTYVGGTAARPAPRTAPAAAAQINIASKLKRIEIAVFTGEKRKYERWKSAFSVCVDQQPLSAEFKLLQLRQYVAGEALDAIESLGYSAAAYDAALRRLERRFGGSRRRLAVRMEELERSPPIRSGRAQDLERFTDVLDMAVVTLKDAGMHTELGTGILYQRIQQKLPVNLLAQYRRWIVHHQKDESVEVLLEWLNAEAEVLAAATETIEGISQQHHVRSQMSTSGTSRNQPTRTATAHDAVQPRTTTFVTATNTAGNVPTARSTCQCCNGGGHPIWRCPEFEKQTVSQRWAAAKRSKSCYRCLATGHSGKDCPRDRECGIDGCTQHHHRLLHSEPRQPPPASSTHASGETGAMQPENFSAVSLGNSTKGEENRVRTVTSIRTVPVQLSNGKRSLTVNALLDDASTRSYIASNVTAELGLVGSSMSLTISKLNGQQETIHTVPVSCTLRSVDGATSTTLHACTIEQPTGNMEVVDWHHLGKQYAHLTNVEFPPLPSKRHIDVLIGADYPELHMAYEERSGNSHEPVARRTALGWTCIGPVNQPKDESIELTAVTVDQCHSELNRLEPSRYSDWVRMCRVHAWCVRFATNCSVPPAQREFDELSPQAIRDSEEFYIKRAQQQSLPEYAAVKAGKPIPANSKLVSLKPMIDDAGLLRVGGRLQHADFLTAEHCNPIVLPRGDHVTQLIVKACHERGYHTFGVSHTLAELSSRYWIVAGREEVRAWEAKCARCARNRTKPAMQVMAPLPKVRVSLPLRAFGRVSVDYAGPFMTKQGRGKTQHKRYLCLFTCLQTRAVHLELSYALTTDSFLQAYVRFTNRRGVPIDVISDNGTNFVGATNELAQLVKQLDAEAIQRQTADQQTSWRFNPPAAPHFGGVHEALVKSAKRAISAILKNAEVTDEELLSAIVGAEALMNSRPLSYVSADGRDPTPLTPNHFMYGQIGTRFAPAGVDESEFNPRQRWRVVQDLVLHFWRRWMQEVVPELNR